MSDQAKAILGAGVLIAAAIYFQPNTTNAKYQFAAVNSDVPMRLNTITGQIDWCTRHTAPAPSCETIMPAAK